MRRKADGWLAAGVVIENDRGEVLLLKRGPTAPWMPGKWNTPGGDVDPGEDASLAARREVKEETGLTVGKMEPLTLLRQQGGKAFMFWTNDWRGTPKHDWESTDMRWVPKDKAPRYDLIPGVNRVLDLVSREPRVARYQPQRAQAFVLNEGSVIVRIPTSEEVAQSDIREGIRDLNKEVKRVMKAIVDAGFKPRRGGWSLDTRDSVFSERIIVPEAKVALDKLIAAVEAIPGLASTSARRVASVKRVAARKF